jgi:hypothetical protein
VSQRAARKIRAIRVIRGPSPFALSFIVSAIISSPKKIYTNEKLVPKIAEAAD